MKIYIPMLKDRQDEFPLRHSLHRIVKRAAYLFDIQRHYPLVALATFDRR